MNIILASRVKIYGSIIFLGKDRILSICSIDKNRWSGIHTNLLKDILLDGDYRFMKRTIQEVLYT